MSLKRAGLAPLLSLLLLGGLVAPVAAQQPAPPAAAPAATPQNLSILVVDVQSLLQNSKSAKMVRQQIEQKRSEFAKEISHEEEKLRHERDALQRQQSSLSAEALNQKGREFQQKVNELDRNVQGKRQTLEKSNAEALENIQSVMLKIITEIAKERKANIVFQRSELVLFDQGFDVTDEVLRKLDEQLPTLTVNFTAPPQQPAPQPAAAAQPAKPQPKKKQN
jgi:Skp family chaperone for outer membrane proteins